MRDVLKLRGAIAFLSRAIGHVGRGQKINDWDGTYFDPSKEAADNILRRALWSVEDAFRKVDGRK